MENPNRHALIEPTRESKTEQSRLGELRESLRAHDSLTPVQILEDVHELHAVADAEIADPKAYRRALADNLKTGLTALLTAKGEKDDARKILTQQYTDVQEMITKEKEYAMEQAQAESDPLDAPIESAVKFGFNNDHVDKSEPSTS